MINQRGLDIIKFFEGLKLKAYECPASTAEKRFFTIGYGTTRIEGKQVQQNTTITAEQAEQYLKADLWIFEKAVSSLITSKINSNQYNAILCFVYNVGAGNFKTSTLLKKVNINPADTSIKDEFLKWNKANGKTLQGLTNRRTKEAELYFTL